MARLVRGLGSRRSTGRRSGPSTIGRRDGLTVTETGGYLEAPLGPRSSIVIAPWLEQSAIDADGWRAEGTLAAKHVVAQRAHSVVALQAGALWVSAPPAHCQEGGGELRALVGYNFSPHAFLNVEAAERALSGGCADWRADVTFGIHAGAHWLGLAQMFVDGPTYGEEAVQAQLSLVRFSAHGHGVQLGARARLGAGAAEPALVFALWSEPERRRRRD